MKLRQLVMRCPNRDFIQAPSEIRAEVEISQEAFNEIAETGRATNVSLDQDGKSNPQQITAYTLPMDVQTENGDVVTWPGRYIVMGD